MARVLIATDVRLFREGLDEILRRRAGLSVIGTASNAAEALSRVGELLPDITLVDVGMTSSLACVRAMTRLCPEMKVLVLGVADIESDVLDCAESGIAGFLSRDASLDDLVIAVESAARGELACSARMAGILLRHVGTLALAQASPRVAPALTVRELQVLRLLDRHLSNKEIAEQLGIEVATVKNHVHNLLEKLKVHRRLDAVASAKEGVAR
jgi:two-component system, NarL family, nitrate/nitrite response regulator NarL